MNHFWDIEMFFKPDDRQKKNDLRCVFWIFEEDS